jgi:hypothetical protein
MEVPDARKILCVSGSVINLAHICHKGASAPKAHAPPTATERFHRLGNDFLRM